MIMNCIFPAWTTDQLSCFGQVLHSDCLRHKPLKFPTFHTPAQAHKSSHCTLILSTCFGSLAAGPRLLWATILSSHLVRALWASARVSCTSARRWLRSSRWADRSITANTHTHTHRYTVKHNCCSDKLQLHTEQNKLMAIASFFWQRSLACSSWIHAILWEFSEISLSTEPSSGLCHWLVP